MAAAATAATAVLALAFPFIARAYATGSIPAVATPEVGTPRTEHGTRVATTGIRSLPLLDEADRAAWTSDPAVALDRRGRQYFGGDYDELVATAESWSSEHLFDSLATYPLAYGGVGDLIARRVQTEDDATSAVGLTSLLLLAASSREIDGISSGAAAVIALALAERAAELSQSCDVQLEAAHALSLVQGVPDEVVLDRLDRAAAVCRDDLTPRAEAAYLELSRVTPGGCGIPTVDAESWSAVFRLFRDIRTDAPNDPAGYVGEADSYRIAAEVLATQNIRPFTVRAFARTAAELYEQARNLSSDESIAVSLARTRSLLGEPEQAWKLLSDLSDATTSSWTVRELMGRVQAERGQYGAAARAVADSGDPDVPATQAMAHGDGQPYAVDELTGRAGARSATLLQTAGGCGSSLVQDRGYVPLWRHADDDLIRDPQLDYLVLARDWDGSRGQCDEPNSADEMACTALSARGEAAQMDEATNDFVQNLWRRFGNVGEAARAATAWVAASGSPLAHERLGEIEFLRKNWAASAHESGEAAQGAQEASASYEELTTTGPGWALLRQAVAEREGGHRDRADLLLAEVVRGYSDRLLLMYGFQEQGAAAYARKKYPDALKAMATSIEIGRELEAPATDGGIGEPVLRGAQAQLASAAALNLGASKAAATYAAQALEIDPYNPLFRETVAEAGRGDDKTSAITSYREALKADPTLFSTWNNVGVLLAQTGHEAEAIDAFEHAVAIRPDYALGWFNLGVVESDRGLSGFLRSQGALGKAGDLDGDLKNEDTTLLFDEQIYDAAIDVSRPVPAEWQLAQSARTRPSLLGVGLILIVLIRIGWALGSDWLVGRGIERSLAKEAPRFPALRRVLDARPGAAWTTAVTLAALLFLSGSSGWVEILVAAVLFGAMLTAHAVAPRLVARRGEVRQVSFLPASILTILLAVPGFGFAPPAPADVGDDERAGIRRSGVAVLACLTVAFCAVALLTGVPVARTAATGALLLLSSALVPVPPLDGARLNLGQRADLAVSLALGGLTVMFAAGAL